MTHVSAAVFDALRRSPSSDAVDTSEETISRYGRNDLPGGDRRPAGVVYPASTAEVQAIVRIANEHRVPLYSFSTGGNRGMGLRSPIQPGQIIVDVGARMNRILEIDETLCFAAIEPGVTYQQMYDELGRRGHTLMMDTTSGPPEGGIVGNTLDKGAGYTPYFDHFGMSCGLEMVLGDGRLLRTADGAFPGAQTWHLAKYGYGPFLDGLFLQSNFGIVTRIGVRLMPRPPVIRAFFFTFPDDEDFGEIIDLVRPLKLNNVVPTLIKVTSDLYAMGAEATYPFDRTGGLTPLPDDVRRELQRQYGFGAWCVSGAFYGASDDAVLPLIERMKAHFGRSGKARYVSHEEASGNPLLQTHIDTFERFADNPEPRVASVLLLDVSGSMSGEPIAQLNAGLTAYKDELAADSLASKRVEVAVVTFGGAVQTVCDFTTAEGFHPPVLVASGDTPMGGAIREGVEMLRRRKDAYRANGILYFRPWLFLITDGGPTDEWQSAAELIKQGEASKAFSFFGVGVEGANMDVLKQICVRAPLNLKGLRFRDLFVWLSQSQRSVSRSTVGDNVQLTNPTGPEGWASV